MWAFSITANCWKSHSSDPYIRIGRIWASHIKKKGTCPRLYRHLSIWLVLIFALAAKSPAACVKDSLVVQRQVLMTIHNLYFLITIPPNLTGSKETCFSECNNLGLTHINCHWKIISKVFQNINLPQSTTSKRQVEHRHQVALSVQHLVLTAHHTWHAILGYQKGKQCRRKHIPLSDPNRILKNLRERETDRQADRQTDRQRQRLR